VIEQVEKIRPELQTQSLDAEWKILRRGEVEVDQAGSGVLIASGRAHPPRRRSLREVSCIERGVRIPVILLYPPGSDYVGTVVKLVEPAEVGRVVKDRKWRSGLDGRDSGNLPAGKNAAIQTVVPREQAMARSYRQLD